MKGMSSHQSQKMLNDEWLTPPEIIQSLGPFDLDPYAPIVRPWDTAEKHYTVNDNGLLQPWDGFIWLNPPYGVQTGAWMRRMAMHGNGIALIFARTETSMFFEFVWPCATSLLFIEGRLYFHYVDGSKAKANSGAPSVLIGYGTKADARLYRSKIPGKYIKLR